MDSNPHHFCEQLRAWIKCPRCAANSVSSGRVVRVCRVPFRINGPLMMTPRVDIYATGYTHCSGIYHIGSLTLNGFMVPERTRVGVALPMLPAHDSAIGTELCE